ncbi:MAG TPA: DUF4214 domain-containing protein, partial [Pyrinomonadaceae bacterium]
AETVAKRDAFAAAWISRGDFAASYPASMSASEYVNKVLQTAGVTVSNKDQLIAGLSNGTETRASVLRKVVESAEFEAKEFDPAYVAMQYYGYLRREPEPAGYNAWLNYLRANPGDYKTMVWGFVYSPEYRNRH